MDYKCDFKKPAINSSFLDCNLNSTQQSNIHSMVIYDEKKTYLCSELLQFYITVHYGYCKKSGRAFKVENENESDQYLPRVTKAGTRGRSGSNSN